MRDNAAAAKLVQQLIRMVQMPWEDNSTQEKHNQRCRIALHVHGTTI